MHDLPEPLEWPHQLLRDVREFSQFYTLLRKGKLG